MYQKLNYTKHKMHPEDHKGYETISNILEETAYNLELIASDYNNIMNTYQDIISQTQDRVSSLDKEYKTLKTKLLKYHELCTFDTNFEGLSFNYENNNLTSPVTAITFISEKDIDYNISINEKSYTLLPFNTKREGKTVVARFGDYPDIKGVEYIQEPIHSFSIEPYREEEIIILYGKAVPDV